jgi:hypothetical protein
MPCTVDSPDSCEELKFMRIVGVDSAEVKLTFMLAYSKYYTCNP